MKTLRQRTLVKKRTAAVCAALTIAALAWPSAAHAAPAVAGPTPLLHGHSHNDYVNSTPLLGALADGYTSIEADVWLKNNQLWACHDYSHSECTSDTPRARTTGSTSTARSTRDTRARTRWSRC